MKLKYEFIRTRTGNAISKYDKPVIYPINAILADTLSKQDEIKVVLLRTENATEISVAFSVLSKTTLISSCFERVSARIALIGYITGLSYFEIALPVLVLINSYFSFKAMAYGFLLKRK